VNTARRAEGKSRRDAGPHGAPEKMSGFGVR